MCKKRKMSQNDISLPFTDKNKCYVSKNTDKTFANTEISF